MQTRAAGPLVAGSRRDRPRTGIEDYCLVKAARATLAGAEARAAAAEQKASQEKGPGPVRNITGPDSRLMPVRGGGFIQGYNTQNVASQDGLILATELTCTPTGTEWSAPMLAKAAKTAMLITGHQPAPAASPPRPPAAPMSTAA